MVLAFIKLLFQKGKTTIDTVTIITYTCVTFSQLAAYHWLGNEVMYKVKVNIKITIYVFLEIHFRATTS